MRRPRRDSSRVTRRIMRRKNPGRTFVVTCIWLACWTLAAGLLDGVSGKYKYCDMRYFTIAGTGSGRGFRGSNAPPKLCCKFVHLKCLCMKYGFIEKKPVLFCYKPPRNFFLYTRLYHYNSENWQEITFDSLLCTSLKCNDG